MRLARVRNDSTICIAIDKSCSTLVKPDQIQISTSIFMKSFYCLRISFKVVNNSLIISRTLFILSSRYEMYISVAGQKKITKTHLVFANICKSSRQFARGNNATRIKTLTHTTCSVMVSIYPFYS